MCNIINSTQVLSKESDIDAKTYKDHYVVAQALKLLKQKKLVNQI
jgi:hypothetical protein